VKTYIPPLWIHTGTIVKDNQTGSDTVVISVRCGENEHATIVRTCEADREPVVEYPCDEFVQQFANTGRRRSFHRLPLPGA